jgi:catechol 2,3-dioxygenase-like lactoylglutathione lyase family enzyme
MVGKLARVILFVRNVEVAKAFYRDVLGLQVTNDEGSFVELDAGSCRIALHKAAKANPGRTKLAFRVQDVEGMRTVLSKNGALMGRLHVGKGLAWCDGKDPDGNAFQISTRA